MCETRDLGTKWLHWHTLIFTDETRIDMRFLCAQETLKIAGAEDPISVVEEVGSKARARRCSS